MKTEALVAWNHGTRLAGTLWMPEHPPLALLMMHPGSGPSDRDNDVLFPPIRDALLEAGVAVCSFDKRGVGGSSGSWLEAGIGAQAQDLLAGSKAAKAILGELSMGLFGHSQGGWVVLEAARLRPPDFVITNSGPAVPPREQETYSTLRSLHTLGLDDAMVSKAMAEFEQTMDLLNVPLLALYGADDNVVPVQRSVQIVRSLVPQERLDLRVLPGGDHRIQIGERFVDGYLEAIVDFVRRVAITPVGGGC